MRYELNRVEPFTLAKNAAVIYGVVTTVLAVLISPFLLLTAMVGGGGGHASGAAAIFSLLFLIAYPFIGAVIGWLFGWGAAATYNLAAPRIGGLKFEMAEAPAMAQAAPAAPQAAPTTS